MKPDARLSHGNLTVVPASVATATGALARKQADAWLRGSQGSGGSIEVGQAG